MTIQIEDSIASYVDALKTTFPVAARQLRTGLDAAAIDHATAERGISLPDELRTLYAQFDGQKSLQLALLPQPLRGEKGLALATLEYLGAWRDNAMGMEALYRNSTRRRMEHGPGVRPAFWSAAWLPFAAGKYERDGLYLKLFVDGAPASDGRAGQVVFEKLKITLEAEHAERQVVADSLADYLQGVADGIRSGAVTWVEKSGLRWR